MRSLQNIIAMSYTNEAVSVLKITVLTGLNILYKASLTFVGATYIGYIFFTYCCSLAGNNSVGIIFSYTSFALFLFMKFTEIILNGLILRPISNVIVLPLIINGTDQMRNAKCLSFQDYTKIGLAFERIVNSTFVKKAKKNLDIFWGK